MTQKRKRNLFGVFMLILVLANGIMALTGVYPVWIGFLNYPLAIAPFVYKPKETTTSLMSN